MFLKKKFFFKNFFFWKFLKKNFFSKKFFLNFFRLVMSKEDHCRKKFSNRLKNDWVIGIFRKKDFFLKIFFLGKKIFFSKFFCWNELSRPQGVHCFLNFENPLKNGRTMTGGGEKVKDPKTSQCESALNSRSRNKLPGWPKRQQEVTFQNRILRQKPFLESSFEKNCWKSFLSVFAKFACLSRFWPISR